MPDQDEQKSGLSKQAEQRMEEVELIEDDHRRAFTGGSAPYDRRGPEDRDKRESDPENVPAINQKQTDDQNRLVDQTDHQNRP